MNNSGQVVGGISTAGDAESHAASWTQAGGWVDLGTLGGTYSNATLVSDSGQVVGESYTAGDAATHPFSWTQAGGMVDLGTLGGTFSQAFWVNSSGLVVGYSTTAGGQYHATLWQVGPSGPVDADGDGIDDAIDTGTGTFQDGGTTAGTIGTIPAGYTVTVTDLPDPDGVHVTVTGTGTQEVTIVLTNPASGAPPCGTVELLPGSDVDLVCGSITARVAANSPPVEIVLSDDTSAFVGAGEQAKVSISIGGSFTIDYVTGGDGQLTLTDNGAASNVGPSPTPVNLWDFAGFSQPVDNNGVYNVAKPGSTIPLKWRLLNEAGAPITNLGSASVSVGAINCQGGAPSDVIEEVAPSPSGLQNLGNGYYQLNWKTDKKWTACRQMRLSLTGEGPITHTALFNFK